MKLKEPDKVAFEFDYSDDLSFDEAKKNREQEFWQTLGLNGLPDALFFDSHKAKKHTLSEIEDDHANLRNRLLSYLKGYELAFASGKCFEPPCHRHDCWLWECVKFILAFDTTFRYIPEDFLDANDDVDYSETDYLDNETTFCYDVIKACDQLAIAGAALAKRIGSESYGLWTDAIIKLTELDNAARCKAADDIVSALFQTWADFRIWIYMNPPHNAEKSEKRSKKSKK